ncbi:MAG: primosomal protein N' [Peptococcaceae bacterium]|jgi:primosomal protein N' (replication factor Y)|nr:primosomal protein N' [Peptococcaceae bacterium]
MLADVLILASESPRDQVLTYLIPRKFERECVPGTVFKAPVLNRFREGLVLRIHDQAPEGIHLKSLAQNLFGDPVLSGRALELASWMSEYYACSMNKAAALFMPPQIRKRPEQVYALRADAYEGDKALFESSLETRLLGLFRTRGDVKAGQIRKALGQEGLDLVQAWVKKGYVYADTAYIARVEGKRASRAELTGGAPGADELSRMANHAPRQKALLEALADGPVDLGILRQQGLTAPGLLGRLERKGWIRVESDRVRRNPMTETLQNKPSPAQLTEEQAEALGGILKGIQAGEAEERLIFGVTGSGKTEVFLRAAEAVIQKGRQVLYMVPEIALTPQVAAGAARRFDGGAAMLHSAMSLGERYDEWGRIQSGEARLIIGPRSALFAPFQDLGMIIIDEEHENTYKQNEPDPRYDARKTAQVLARLHHALLIRGSATPSLLTYSRALAGEIALSRLTDRVARRPMPEIQLVNMSAEMRDGWRKPLSRPLLEALNTVINRGEQAILLMNRRGYHTYVFCRECGKTLACPRCSISMTYHKSEEMMICHYCGERRPLPARCPACGSSALQYMGTGTERVTDALKTELAGKAVLRMDTDTTRTKGSHTNILKAFQSSEAQVLVGTQMVAKGLDFPLVTLVGIIHVDGLLNLPDYQGAERAFQMVVQAAGRAGRGERPGRVMIQTFDPGNPLFQTIRDYDYETFFEKEIQFREAMEYPPKMGLARILISSKEEKEGLETASRLTDFVNEIKIEAVTVLGPSPAPVFRIQDRFRHHIILRCPFEAGLTELLNQVRRRLIQGSPEPRVILDRDPQTLV